MSYLRSEMNQCNQTSLYIQFWVSFFTFQTKRICIFPSIMFSPFRAKASLKPSFQKRQFFSRFHAKARRRPLLKCHMTQHVSKNIDAITKGSWVCSQIATTISTDCFSDDCCTYVKKVSSLLASLLADQTDRKQVPDRMMVVGVMAYQAANLYNQLDWSTQGDSLQPNNDNQLVASHDFIMWQKMPISNTKREVKSTHPFWSGTTKVLIKGSHSMIQLNWSIDLKLSTTRTASS